MDDAPDSAEHRLGVLDGLRALAITLVLLRHNLRPYWYDFNKPFLPIGPLDLGGFFLNGWCGVDLFFVLSGFLITRQLLLYGIERREGRGGVIKLFYKRRFFRIAPAYYVVIALAILGLTYPYPMNGRPGAWSVLYHLFFMEDYLPADILPAFWSLAVEAKFYLAAPFIVLVLCACKPRLRFLLLAALCLTAVAIKFATVLLLLPLSSDYAIYVRTLRAPLHLVFDGLIDGMGAALLWHEPPVRKFLERPFVSNALFFGGVAAMLALLLPRSPIDAGVTLFDKTLLGPLLALAFSTMMLGLLGGCRGNELFAARPLRLVALVSYSVYLIHLPLVLTAYAITQRFLPGSSPALQWAFSLLPFTLLCGFVATILYLTVERPFINWSKDKPVWG
jgi:peptidoglycan/LPS O-acetylase OafA/YrhL